MDFGLKDKIALIAGSSKGLGRAVAEELAAEGAGLVLCARDSKSLKATCDEITNTTRRPVVTVAADLTRAEDISRVVNAGLERFGRIDILFTNNGGPPTGQFESLSQSQWEAAVRLTLYSAIELTRQVLPGMKQRRWGRILNITSIAVKQPVDNLMLSNSLRAAVTGFARTLANEVATLGITVNNIMPGYTRTERVEQLADAIAAREGVAPSAIKARWEA